MPRIRRAFAILAVIALAGGSPTMAAAQGAPTAETLKLANELFALLTRDLLLQMTQQFTAQLWPRVETSLGVASDSAASAELRTEYERIMLDVMLDAMKEAPAIYARNFSAQELREVTAFYSTATGRKLLGAMPTIMAESMALVIPRMQDIESQAEEAFRRVLRARGYLK